MPLRQQERVSELQFLVYARPLHPELFDIYHDHRIAKGPYEAQVWITGVSHLISFHHAETTLTELLAETGTMLPKRGLLAAMPVRGEKDHEATHANGVRYMASFQVERMSPALFTKVHEELADQGAGSGLFVPFPEWTSNTLMPFTYLEYEARADLFHVFAYHAFPDELTFIKTQSVFELP
jgi:hypothetical protein